MMSKVPCAIKVDNDDVSVPTTPDIHVIKCGSACKESELPPFALLDHGYGRTPQTGYRLKQPINLTRTQVKRRLNLESTGEDDSIGFKTPKSRKKNNSVKSPPSRGQAKTPTRYDTSLGLLTKKFVNLLQMSNRGIVDLNYASRHLEVQKRRIYDITNVLEGIGILEKRSKNNIQWRGGNLAGSQSNVQRDIENLEKEEKHLDQLIKKVESDFKSLSKDEQYSYICYQDLRSIKSFTSRTVMVIKAPPFTELMIPCPTSPTHNEIILKSANGEIEVFLCPDTKSLKDDRALMGPEASTGISGASSSTPIKQDFLSIPKALSLKTDDEKDMDLDYEDETSSLLRRGRKRLMPGNNSGICINTRGLLCHSSDDFDHHQLQTEDQHSSEQDANLCDDDLPPFLSLEPPMSENEYLYSLDADEGLADLFDFDL